MIGSTEVFGTAAVLALSIASVAFTISRTKVTEGLRLWVMEKNTWLGGLVKCPYCLSHWLTFGAVIIYRPRLVELFWPLDLLVSAMAMVTVTAFFVGVIARAVR